MRFFVLTSFLSVLLFGCDSSNEAEPISKDTTPLTYDKIEYYIFESRTNATEFNYGQRLNIEVFNLNGFEIKDNTLYPGVSFEILAPDGSILQHAADLYEGKEFKIKGDETFNPSFYIDLLHPIVPDKKYTMRLNMWDKQSGRSVPVSKTFDVKEPVKNGFVKTSGDSISPEILMVFKNGQPYSGNTFSPGDRIHLHVVLNPDFLEQQKAFTAVIKSFSGGTEVFKREESGTFSKDIGPLNSYIMIRQEDYEVGSSYTIQFDLVLQDGSGSYSLEFPIKVVEAVK